MPRYSQIAQEIEKLIVDRKLQPGEALPSERELADHLGVTYGIVRWANDLLVRKGIVQRQHGRGTFLAIPPTQSDMQKRYRLGLVYVDMPDIGPYLRLIAFAVQRLAQKAGYELVIEQMQTERILKGAAPEMIQRRSVDGILAYGSVRDFHLDYFKQHSMPFVVLGNCPLTVPAPQVRLGARGLLYEITRELIEARRDPIWFEVDPAEKDYHTGQEMLGGYAEAMERHGRSASLHLCPLSPERIGRTAQMICRSGLENAALIAEHWPVALLPGALAAIHPEPERLLYVPLPFVEEMPRIISGPNVVQWTQLMPAEEVARQAVEQLLDCLEEKAEQLHAITIEPKCRLMEVTPQARMEASWSDQVTDSFAVERGGERCWIRPSN